MHPDSITRVVEFVRVVEVVRVVEFVLRVAINFIEVEK